MKARYTSDRKHVSINCRFRKIWGEIGTRFGHQSLLLSNQYVQFRIAEELGNCYCVLMQKVAVKGLSILWAYGLYLCKWDPYKLEFCMYVHVSELPVMHFQLIERIFWTVLTEFSVTEFHSPKSPSPSQPWKATQQ